MFAESANESGGTKKDSRIPTMTHTLMGPLFFIRQSFVFVLFVVIKLVALLNST